jgi:Zn-dependent alcohol dehydrogenase
MKAAVLHKPGEPLRIEDLTLAEPQPVARMALWLDLIGGL